MDDLQGRRSHRRGINQPNYQGGESSMDVRDWRNQLPSDLRERSVNKIRNTLERHLLCSPEGFAEIKKIAVRFEEKIFSSASNQSDYLNKISLKLLSMESKNQAVNQEVTLDCVPFNKVEEVIKEIDSQFNSFDHLPTSQGEQSSIDAIDWRNQLLTDTRERIVNKIRETLERHLPFSGPEGRSELMKIAGRFEEKMFSAASNQSDYLCRMSMEMLSIESKSQRLNQEVTTDSVPNNWKPTPCEWRDELPPDSREKMVNKIRDILARNLPFSGPEGSKEVKRIAIRFEKKIFSSASSQSDYLHKISSKMLSLESKCRNANKLPLDSV
ncbi:hypothetical protein LWI29_000318 [Acer saccharum]|uniref:Mediator complex subunit 15 KIX domain-containing protein n=1 Tax=Acer saccharum TaxID=4024 RepID=A0AA39VPS7_ACESA|nr:hypothetical protein LWI29_000318 [Acer saccharum]KAK1574937.1 hypothetical protein Q3G72_001153 [Acer saccharum]